MIFLVKGISECPVKRGRPSAVLLPHLPMLLSQLVRWDLPQSDGACPPPDWGKSPNPPLSSLRLRSGDFLDRLKSAVRSARAIRTAEHPFRESRA